MLRRSLDQSLNLPLELERLLAKVWHTQLLGAQFHRSSQERGETSDKLGHLAHLGELLAQVLDLAQQVGVAILNRTGRLIVTVVTVHHQGSRQAFDAEHLLGHARRAALAKAKETDSGGAKEPGVTVVPIVAPTRLVGVLDGSAAIFQEQALRNPSQASGQLVQGRP